MQSALGSLFDHSSSSDPAVLQPRQVLLTQLCLVVAFWYPPPEPLPHHATTANYESHCLPAGRTITPFRPQESASYESLSKCTSDRNTLSCTTLWSKSLNSSPKSDPPNIQQKQHQKSGLRDRQHQQLRSDTITITISNREKSATATTTTATTTVDRETQRLRKIQLQMSR